MSVLASVSTPDSGLSYLADRCLSVRYIAKFHKAASMTRKKKHEGKILTGNRGKNKQNVYQIIKAVSA
jgi:hypothetical protein